MKKHILYYEFLDALNSGECPICFLVRVKREKYFEHIIGEQVNDIGFRKKLRDNHGFCNYHAYKFLSYKKPLASAIIYKDLFDTEISFLKKGKFPHPPKKCIVCDIEKEAEKSAIQLINKYKNDSDFKNTFLKSKGLCMPHYKKVMLEVNSMPKWFIDFHLERYEKISKILYRFIDSENFSLRDKRPVLTKEEELIWKEAIKTFTGYEGMKW
jgi:hypothetical protein